MDEFWQALLRGLAPEKKSDTNLWWQIPAAMFVIILVLGVLS